VEEDEGVSATDPVREEDVVAASGCGRIFRATETHKGYRLKAAKS